MLAMRCLLFVGAFIASLTWGADGVAQEQVLPGVLPPPGSGLPGLPSVPPPNAISPNSALSDGATSQDSSSSAPAAMDDSAVEASSNPTPELVPGPEAIESAALVDPILDPLSEWYEPRYWFGPEPWSIRYELGINGSRSENDTFSMRTGGDIKRKTELWKMDSSISYFKNSSNQVETQNNAKLDSRIDRLLGKSPWTLYFLTNVLYDKFQTFDMRLSFNTGVGFHFVDTPALNLLGRFGAGASREFGGVDDRTPQELLLGLDYEYQLSKMQRLIAKVDYYPEWNDFNQYRMVSDFGWEIDLDRPENVSLKLSMQDQYDSTSGAVAPNQFNYSVLMIWSP
jgi:putative salt-induced outer membrane protein YdiY